MLALRESRVSKVVTVKSETEQVDRVNAHEFARLLDNLFVISRLVFFVILSGG